MSEDEDMQEEESPFVPPHVSWGDIMRKGGRGRSLMIFAMSCVATVILSLVAAVVYLGIVKDVEPSPSRPKPLYGYEIRQLVGEDNVLMKSNPTIHLGDPIRVQAIRCNRSKARVPVYTENRWSQIEPPGTTVFVRDSQVKSRPPGCETVIETPIIPVEVHRAMTEMLETRGFVTWNISGVDIVVEGTKKHPEGGQVVPWTSTNFRVVK